MLLHEFLLPVLQNDGKRYPEGTHAQFFECVALVAGGYTQFPNARGAWRNDHGAPFEENMVPLRVACTPEEAQEVLRLCGQFFPDQHTIMFYVLSDQVNFASRPTLEAFEEHHARKIADKLATLGNRASQAAWDIEDALRRVRVAALEHKGEALATLLRVTQSAQAIA